MKTSQRIIILMYHMISRAKTRPENRYSLPSGRFRRQMRYLKYKGYKPISLDNLHGYLAGKDGSLPEKSLVITFDDGYRDNYENAFPILKEHGYPATVFAVSGLVGKVNSWMTTEGYPEEPLMGWSEIKEMQRHGITIGAHTLNHPRLTRISPEEAKKEVADSKKLLEDKLGTRINHFAYPYGDMNGAVVDMVKDAGYKTACSTKSGFNSKKVSLLELRRLDVYGTDSLLNFTIKLKYGTNDGDLLFPARYYVRRLSERIK